MISRLKIRHNSRLRHEAIIAADISAVTPAVQVDLIDSIKERLPFGDQVVSFIGDLLTVRTDDEARVVRFIQGFGGRVEQRSPVADAVTLIEAGLPVDVVIDNLMEGIPTPINIPGPDPRESCDEDEVWDKTIGRCRPLLGTEIGDEDG